MLRNADIQGDKHRGGKKNARRPTITPRPRSCSTPGQL